MIEYDKRTCHYEDAKNGCTFWDCDECKYFYKEENNMNAEEQIFAYKELRNNGQGFLIDTYEDADRIIEALEKQTPKKVIRKERGTYSRFCCPNNHFIFEEHHFDFSKHDFSKSGYCECCGQKLDWSEWE